MKTAQDTQGFGSGRLRDNKALNRFEWSEAGETSIVSYHHDGSVLVLDHSFVPEALAGRGIGSRLVRAVLDHLLTTDQKIAVRCDFINHVINRHAAYQALLQR